MYWPSRKLPAAWGLGVNSLYVAFSPHTASPEGLSGTQLEPFFWKYQRWLSWLVSALQGAQMWWAEGLELRSKMTVKKTMISPTAAAEHAGPGLTFKLFARLAT